MGDTPPESNATVELAERPDPEPGPDETLVEVSAAPIVPLDLLCASGTSYFGPAPLCTRSGTAPTSWPTC